MPPSPFLSCTGRLTIIWHNNMNSVLTLTHQTLTKEEHKKSGPVLKMREAFIPENLSAVTHNSEHIIFSN